MVPVVLIIYGGLAFISGKYLNSLHRANEKNKALAEYYERILHYLIQKKDQKIEFINIPSITGKAKKTNWAFNWQLISIILFAVASGILVLVRFKTQIP